MHVNITDTTLLVLVMVLYYFPNIVLFTYYSLKFVYYQKGVCHGLYEEVNYWAIQAVSFTLLHFMETSHSTR